MEIVGLRFLNKEVVSSLNVSIYCYHENSDIKTIILKLQILKRNNLRWEVSLGQALQNTGSLKHTESLSQASGRSLLYTCVISYHRYLFDDQTGSGNKPVSDLAWVHAQQSKPC